MYIPRNRAAAAAAAQVIIILIYFTKTCAIEVVGTYLRKQNRVRNKLLLILFSTDYSHHHTYPAFVMIIRVKSDIIGIIGITDKG